MVGYAVTMPVGDVADLQRIARAPARQRSGWPGAARPRPRRAARAGGADRMLLEVSATNARGRRLLRRRGFAEIDRRPRYYRDGADADGHAPRRCGSGRLPWEDGTS